MKSREVFVPGTPKKIWEAVKFDGASTDDLVDWAAQIQRDAAAGIYVNPSVALSWAEKLFEVAIANDSNQIRGR